MSEAKLSATSPDRNPGSRCGCTVVGFCLLALGLALCWPAFRASRWPTAPGTILESSFAPTHGRIRVTTAACRVTYWFTVKGVRFTGNKLDALPVSTTGSGPAEDLARYPKGAPCEVHYNPDDPNDSCLRPEPSPAAWIIMAFGSCFVAVAASMWAIPWWRRTSPGRG